MSKPLAAHHRDDRPEKPAEILARTTPDRCTVLWQELHHSIRPVIIKKDTINPPTYHLYRLNEHNAYCNDRMMDRQEAYDVVSAIIDADSFIAPERQPAEAVWPGHPHYTHPSKKSAAIGGVQGP